MDLLRSEGWTLPAVCLLLLFGGLVMDLNTTQELVVAIIYAVPIALSGARTSRTLTWWCISLALLANIGAGYDNMAASGIVDRITILNRVLAGLSFLLVGAMTLLLESTSEEVEHLSEAEEEGERQKHLREFLVELSGPLEPEEVMERAVTGLRRLLGADAVVATTLDGERFSEPRWSDPPSSDLASPGSLASWAVDALPITARPVIAVRSDQGMMSVGRWRCATSGDLIVLAARPDRHRAARVLGDALSVLDPIRERAIELQRARSSAAPSSADPGPTVRESSAPDADLDAGGPDVDGRGGPSPDDDGRAAPAPDGDPRAAPAPDVDAVEIEHGVGDQDDDTATPTTLVDGPD